LREDLTYDYPECVLSDCISLKINATTFEFPIPVAGWIGPSQF
jgi:hypothetical protein